MGIRQCAGQRIRTVGHNDIKLTERVPVHGGKCGVRTLLSEVERRDNQPQAFAVAVAQRAGSEGAPGEAPDHCRIDIVAVTNNAGRRVGITTFQGIVARILAVRVRVLVTRASEVRQGQVAIHPVEPPLACFFVAVLQRVADERFPRKQHGGIGLRLPPGFNTFRCQIADEEIQPAHRQQGNQRDENEALVGLLPGAPCMASSGSHREALTGFQGARSRPPASAPEPCGQRCPCRARWTPCP
jgi:hypothetical protein